MNIRDVIILSNFYFQFLAASLFENQDAENENELNSPSALLNPEDYTVLASSHEGASCPQCGESFESYFDEEREEWRLKNAKLDDCDGDMKLYHPNCYEVRAA